MAWSNHIRNKLSEKHCLERDKKFPSQKTLLGATSCEGNYMKN